MLWVASRWYFTLVIVTFVVVFGGGGGARVSCRLAIVIKERLLGWMAWIQCVEGNQPKSFV